MEYLVKSLATLTFAIVIIVAVVGMVIERQLKRIADALTREPK